MNVSSVEECVYLPAVCELGPHVLQVRVAHVVDGKDEEVLILLDGGLDVRV